MPIPVGSCEVWFRFELAGDSEPMYSHLAYDMVSAPTQAQVNAGFAAFQTLWKPTIGGSWTLAGGHVLVGNDGGSIRWDSAIAGVVGTGGGTSVPQNCAYLLKKVTASGGRRNRGRMYVPGIPDAFVNDAGVVTPGVLTTLQTCCTGLLVGGSVHSAFVFLGQAQLLHESGDLTPTEVTNLVPQSVIATQRRRLRR